MAEHEYNNPVVLAFIECILHSTQSLSSMPGVKTSQNTFCRNHKKKLVKDLEKRVSPVDLFRDPKDNIMNDFEGISIPNKKNGTLKRSNSSSSKKARARWFLAYTLTNNPGVSFSLITGDLQY